MEIQIILPNWSTGVEKKKKIKLIKAKIRTCSCLWRNRGRNAGLRRAKKWDNRLQNEHEWTVSCSKKVKSSCYLDYTRNPHREHNLQQGVWESKPTARNDEGRGCLTLRTVLKNTNDSCQEEHKAKFGSRQTGHIFVGNYRKEEVFFLVWKIIKLGNSHLGGSQGPYFRKSRAWS